MNGYAVMTVSDLIQRLQAFQPTMRVVAEYDSQVYPIVSVVADVVPKYPTYDLVEGQHVCLIQRADYY